MENAPVTQASGLSEYFLLGRSGLRVSPLCLGTMTFGTEWGFGSDRAVSRRIFDRYLEAGGNFIDTADGYTNGKSEELVGEFLREGRTRDRVVLATKFTFNGSQGDPNAGGNGRKNIHRALEQSLRRLQTDYIDLYWLHAWDGITPLEEVMTTLDSLVKAGKIRHIGFSDTPAWYLTRAQTLAELRGWERVSALQLEYSLVERNIEREHIPAALELGMAVLPWSPLAGGLLSGKYQQSGGSVKGQGRLQTLKSSGNPVFEKLTEPNFRIAELLGGVARELGRSPAQVAINWVTRRPGVVSTLIGATTVQQLDDNLEALDFVIPDGLASRLEQAGRPPRVFPYVFFGPEINAMVHGGASVKAEPSWYRPALR